MILGHDIYFWFAVFGAGFVRLVLQPMQGVFRTTVSFFVALTLAIIFTDSVVAYLNLDPNVYKNGVAALITLTGEGIARWVLGISNSPDKVLDFLKFFKGGR